MLNRSGRCNIKVKVCDVSRRRSAVRGSVILLPLPLPGSTVYVGRQEEPRDRPAPCPTWHVPPTPLDARIPAISCTPPPSRTGPRGGGGRAVALAKNVVVRGVKHSCPPPPYLYAYLPTHIL